MASRSKILSLRRMSGRCAVGVFLSLICSISFSPVLAATDPAKIDSSITRAKEWLYKQQSGDHWEQSFGDVHGDQSTGLTALVVYALLSCGESPQDPHIVSAVNYLKKTEATGTYALGMRCQVWLSLPQTPDIRQAMSKDATILRTSMITTGEGRGFYPYNPAARAWSLSRAQYAVLGMWAAAQAGIEVPNTYWQIVEKAWIDAQQSNGGWSYKINDPKYEMTPGITAVGVATLFITQEYLHAGDSATPHGNLANPNIDRGMSWMVANFDKVATNTTYARDYPYATLYAVERIGVASGQRYIGTIDWYDKGAGWLLSKQKNDGSWWPDDFGNVANTSFSLLFLARGRAPIAMNKLDYSISGSTKPANWNQRPRDAANVTRWVGKQIEKQLNWQIVNLSGSPMDWHDAPILYISGSDDVTLDATSQLKLKQFIEQGGMIVANADAGGRLFAGAIRRLGQAMFPAYEFRELPPEHVIYTSEQFPRAKWRTKPSVLGLSNGVRELILLIPQADPARWWQTQIVAAHEEHWQMLSDIFLYGVDSKVLRNRGDSYQVARDESIKATRVAKVARLKYPGNWDPEPDGWRRLANVLHNRYKLDITAATVDLEKEALTDIKIAHLTGTGGMKLSDAARAKLKEFVNGGGTLVIDAAGGNSAFATAAEGEITAIFGSTPMEMLLRENPLYSAGGTPLAAVGYRTHAAKILGTLKDEPRLKALMLNGRPAVVFSREDLSAGLVGQAVDGIVGYDPATATELMSRIVVAVTGG